MGSQRVRNNLNDFHSLTHSQTETRIPAVPSPLYQLDECPLNFQLIQEIGMITTSTAAVITTIYYEHHRCPGSVGYLPFPFSSW